MEQSDLFTQEIIRLYQRKPFVPFEIVLKTGQRLPVVDPSRMAMNEKTVVVIPPNSTHEWFHKEQIASVEVQEAPF